MMIKYPRTYHIPSSNATKDDRVHSNLDFFNNKDVVITEKMDGENATIYTDYFHARSLNSVSHPSQGWIRNFANKIGWQIPEGWRICGENLYAKHSVVYNDLESYFMVFSIWNEKNKCLSWDDTLEWCELLDMKNVPVLYIGQFKQNIIDNLIKDFDINNKEGFVIRLLKSFLFTNFKYSVAKWVRPNHVDDSVKNWRTNWDESKINKLR